MSGKVIKVLSNIRFIRHKQGAAPPEKSALPPVATSETRITRLKRMSSVLRRVHRIDVPATRPAPRTWQRLVP
jgi:hypothetical protein